MVRSPAPEASRPPGSTARAHTEPEWPSRVAWSWPLAGSQSLMVPSNAPEASRPPGSTARALTQSEWPSRVAWSWPLAGSQSLMVQSSAPEASRPPGSTARAFTVLPSPLRVRSRASSARRLAERGRGSPACWSWVMAWSRRLVAAAPVGPPGGSVGQRARSWEGSCSGWAASTWEALRSTRR